MRSTASLPTGAELANILEREASRTIPNDRQDAHFVDFSTCDALLGALDLEVRLSDRFSAPLNLDELTRRSDELMTKIVDQLLQRYQVSEVTAACDAVYDYLSETDPTEAADLLFVFGAKTTLRIEHAVHLYKQGLAPRILVSGHAPLTGEETTSEAERYRDYAITQGVPPDAILLENASVTIPDNVRCSLNLLDERGEQPKSIILVNSPYVQRRGYAHMQKYVWPNTKINRQNCGTLEKYQKDHWYTSIEGIKVVMNEFMKLKIAVTLNTA